MSSFWDDAVYMRRALRLAARGRHASPNPMVGCVLVAPGGRIVGEGFHPQAGLPHAEFYALRAAGERVRGATAYVTLEPCAHHGRTPPCADALIAAGVERVVVAMRDLNPVAAGGLERLMSAGISVSVGVEEAHAQALNAAFVKTRTTGLPWVVLKTAASLDGKTATRTGDSRWITSDISRRAVHRQLRDRCDVILTGVGTLLADDPSLTTRLTHRLGRDPLRLIVDSRARTPLNSQIVRRAAEDDKTIIAVTEAAPSAHVAALRDAGCAVWDCAADVMGRVDLTALLRRLGTQGHTLAVLAECGEKLAAALLFAGLVDRWMHYIAPKVIGGEDAPGVIGGLGAERVADAIETAQWRIRRSGSDLLIDARL